MSRFSIHRGDVLRGIDRLARRHPLLSGVLAQLRIPVISYARSGSFRTFIPEDSERLSERSDAGSFLDLEGVRFGAGSEGGFHA